MEKPDFRMNQFNFLRILSSITYIRIFNWLLIFIYDIKKQNKTKRIQESLYSFHFQNFNQNNNTFYLNILT